MIPTDNSRRRIFGELSQLSQEIRELPPQDPLREQWLAWVVGFAEDFKLDENGNQVKKRAIAALRPHLLDTLMREPLDDHPLLASDGRLYSLGALAVRLHQVAETLRHRHPVNPDEPRPFYADPYPFAHRLAVWIRLEDPKFVPSEESLAAVAALPAPLERFVPNRMAEELRQLKLNIEERRRNIAEVRAHIPAQPRQAEQYLAALRLGRRKDPARAFNEAYAQAAVEAGREVAQAAELVERARGIFLPPNRPLFQALAEAAQRSEEFEQRLGAALDQALNQQEAAHASNLRDLDQLREQVAEGRGDNQQIRAKIDALHARLREGAAVDRRIEEGLNRAQKALKERESPFQMLGIVALVVLGCTGATYFLSGSGAFLAPARGALGAMAGISIDFGAPTPPTAPAARAERLKKGT